MSSHFHPIMRASQVLALIFWCASTALMSAPAQAQVPRTLNYQGYLTNPSGGAITNPTLSLTFKLYTAATGGTALYSETQPNVIVINGIFNALIGSVTPLGLAFDQLYFVGVSVGADPEMMPRQPLAASPYAIRSATTEALAANGTNCTAGQFATGVDALGNAEGCAVPLGTGVSSITAGAGLAGGTITGTGTISIPGGGVTAAMLAQNGCASGQALRWSGSGWACMADAITLSFGYLQPNGNGFETAANSWIRAGTFVYRGTVVQSAPGAFIAQLYTTNPSSWYRVRIFDRTNNSVIAASLASNVGVLSTLDVVNLGTVSNLPAGPAIFEVQVLSTDVTGNSGVAGRQSIGIASLQTF